MNGGCTRNLTNHYQGSCGLEYGNKIIFTVVATGCRVKVQDGSLVFDGLCYQIPGGDNKLFNS